MDVFFIIFGVYDADSEIKKVNYMYLFHDKCANLCEPYYNYFRKVRCFFYYYFVVCVCVMQYSEKKNCICVSFFMLNVLIYVNFIIFFHQILLSYCCVIRKHYRTAILQNCVSLNSVHFFMLPKVLLYFLLFLHIFSHNRLDYTVSRVLNNSTLV